MAPKTSAEMEPRDPPSHATAPDDVEPWRQSSVDLHQGLEVTEISPARSTSTPAAAVVRDLEAACVPRRFDGLAPEEAAEIEAIWWYQHRRSP
jgi:hypothetical protein